MHRLSGAIQAGGREAGREGRSKPEQVVSRSQDLCPSAADRDAFGLRRPARPRPVVSFTTRLPACCRRLKRSFSGNADL